MPTVEQVTLRGVMPNGEPLNTGWQFDKGVSTATPQALAEAIKAGTETAWGVGSRANRWSLDFSWLGVAVHEYDVATGDLLGVGETNLDGAGTSSTNPLPAQVAVVASFRTATPGPRGRGRMYLGGFTIGAVSATGTIVDAAVEDISDFVVDVVRQTLALDATMVPVVWSRRHKLIFPVTVVGIGTSFDVMRSRANRRREGYDNVAV